MKDILVIPGKKWQAHSYIVGDILFDAGIEPEEVQPYKNQIKKIVITHGHYDHIAHLDLIASLCDAEIFIGEYDYDFLFDGKLSLCHLFGEKQPHITDATKLHEGDTIHDFVVYHTPGHTRGSICLFRPTDNMLICGDTLFSDGGYGRWDLPTGDYSHLKASITRLAALPVESMWCGHGDSVFSNAKEHVHLSMINVMSRQ